MDSKYKIQLKGYHNKGVYRCENPECDANLFKHSDELGSTFDNAIGFADSSHGLMMVIECPKCFEKWYYHGSDCIDYFLDSIEYGTNKHWDENGNRRY